MTQAPNSIWRNTAILIATLLFSITCAAQQMNVTANQVEQQVAAIQKQCQSNQYVASSTYFAALREEAVALDKKVCTQLNQANTRDTQALSAAFSDFGQKARRTLESTFSNTSLAEKVNRQAAYFEGEMQDRTAYYFLQLERPKKLSTFSSVGIGKSAFRFSNFSEVVQVTESDEATCREKTELKQECSTLLKDFSDAIAPYQFTLVKLSAGLVIQHLDDVEKEWNDYWKNARALSFLDLAWTSFIEHGSSTKASSLTGPPARQWFVLHPNIVFEHVSGAPAGQRTKEALSVEWLGVNFWKKNDGRIPLGLSLTSLYSDRADVKSIGHGLTLYVDNKYALGVTRRDGKTGIFFSVDLLKAFDNSKEKALQLKNSLGQ
ncbi:hypothetical protein H8K55_10170 [Undibacterium sp. LX15W]|uniref:Uncharacterized protein n=2 Tax=Undibacterium flavidum TaxID=2762297 RepID=A0ABR6YBE5_9BURK|nr:hypothetical protein [Undibacterium flavidum]